MNKHVDPMYIGLPVRDSIAIDVTDYVTALARRVRAARKALAHPPYAAKHHPRLRQLLDDARDYLLHRRIPMNESVLDRIDYINRKPSTTQQSFGPRIPRPPCPSNDEIDATLESWRGKTSITCVDEMGLLFNRTRTRLSVESTPRPKPPRKPARKPAREKTRPASITLPPPPPPAPPRDICFAVWDELTSTCLTGPNLYRLARECEEREIEDVEVYVALGRHPIVLNRIHHAFDPKRLLLDCGEHRIDELTTNHSLREFIASIP